jgi:hypothetical protein
MSKIPNTLPKCQPLWQSQERKEMDKTTYMKAGSRIRMVTPLPVRISKIAKTRKRKEMDMYSLQTKNLRTSIGPSNGQLVILLPLGGATYRQFPVSFYAIEKHY